MKIRFAIPLLAAALTFSVSACGSDSGDSASDGGSTSSAGSSENPAMSQEEAEKELKERGYELKKNDDGTTTVTGGGGTQVTAKQLEKFKKNAECLRGKGYDMPTPTMEKPLVTPKGQYDQDKFNQDSMACAQQGG